jgi:DNA-binding GntR family transcriptional regulator
VVDRRTTEGRSGTGHPDTPPESGAYDAISDLIRAGTFRSGQRLNAAEIAQRIGVSRTPVREALARLGAEGVVQLLPNRGARLADLDRADLLAILDIRALVEPQGARLAALHADENDLRTLAEILDRLESPVGDSESANLKLNSDFHAAIMDASKSSQWRAVFRHVAKEPLLQLHGQGKSLNRDRQSRQHREILAALNSGNPALAEVAMSLHMQSTRQSWLTFLDSGGRS